MEDQPAMIAQRALDRGMNNPFIPAAPLQRNRAQLRQIHAVRIDARMHAAQARKTRRMEAFGERRYKAERIGIA